MAVGPDGEGFVSYANCKWFDSTNRYYNRKEGYMKYKIEWNVVPQLKRSQELHGFDIPPTKTQIFCSDLNCDFESLVKQYGTVTISLCDS